MSFSLDVRQLVTPLTSEQLAECELLPCPRCADVVPLDANACWSCAYLVNPANYFTWLANRKPEEGK